MVALPLLLTECSLAYLTDHAGEVDASDATSAGMPSDSGVYDVAALDAGSADTTAPDSASDTTPDTVVVDDVDAGWSMRVDASTGFADLAAVWGSNANDVWVVGYNMIVHWDGMAWSTSPANVGPLNGVWGTSRTDVWAVGEGGAILHYDGMAWFPSDAGTTATLNGVWGTGTSDVWAVGEQDGGGPIFHWDGKAWSSSATTGSGLQAVWGSSGLVWAVGNGKRIIEYKNGAWSPQSIQVSVPDDFHTVWGSSATSVWAGGPSGPLVYYEGVSNTWAPAAMSFGLNCLWGSGPSDIWGVGLGGSIVHYDGSSWKPIPSGTTVGVNGVWGTGPNDVWAVGTGGTILHHP
jgi:hypothetical protein